MRTPQLCARTRWHTLLHLYDENFLRLLALFPHLPQFSGEWRSVLGADGAISVRLIARETHTAVIKLTHVEARNSTPDAYLRVYFDARQAEVTHFQSGAELRKLLAPNSDAKAIARRRLRLNLFLSKWLDFLADLGHHKGSWQRVDFEPANPEQSGLQR